MHNFPKKIMPLMMACFSLYLFSCNDAPKQDTTATAATDTAAMAPVPAPPPAAPQQFTVTEISHTVKDFSKWKKAFDDDSAARIASGLKFLVMGRQIDKPNNVMIFFEHADLAKSKAFTSDPRLKEVMQKNGVISKPEFGYFKTERFNSESKEKQWVVLTYKVKDYDTWLKAYDSVGKDTRASFGLVDVVLARGIDDPQMVQVIFDITDMAKAKARMSDPAVKKSMMDAGMVGPPKMAYFTTAAEDIHEMK